MSAPAYFIFDVTVHDPEKLKPYLDNAGMTLQHYGGKTIIASEITEHVEGNQLQGTIIMIQFESIEQARAWYHSAEYQAIIGYRLAATTSNVYLIKGVASASTQKSFD